MVRRYLALNVPHDQIGLDQCQWLIEAHLCSRTSFVGKRGPASGWASTSTLFWCLSRANAAILVFVQLVDRELLGGRVLLFRRAFQRLINLNLELVLDV